MKNILLFLLLLITIVGCSSPALKKKDLGVFTKTLAQYEKSPDLKTRIDDIAIGEAQKMTFGNALHNGSEMRFFIEKYRLGLKKISNDSIKKYSALMLEALDKNQNLCDHFFNPNLSIAEFLTDEDYHKFAEYIITVIEFGLNSREGTDRDIDFLDPELFDKALLELAMNQTSRKEQDSILKFRESMFYNKQLGCEVLKILFKNTYTFSNEQNIANIFPILASLFVKN